MKNIICNCPIFNGVSHGDIKSFLSNDEIRIKQLKKDEVIINAGEEFKYIAVVYSGRLVGEVFSASGKREVINIIERHDVFGDVLAMSENNHSPATVSAVMDSQVIMIPVNIILSGFDEVKLKILKNLLKSVSEKYFDQKFRLSCVSQPRLRDKIMRFLEIIRKKSGKEMFQIPFDREGMADYLCVDRSALSRELSRMKKEGIIDYEKNIFKII